MVNNDEESKRCDDIERIENQKRRDGKFSELRNRKRFKRRPENIAQAVANRFQTDGFEVATIEC